MMLGEYHIGINDKIVYKFNTHVIFLEQQTFHLFYDEASSVGRLRLIQMFDQITINTIGFAHNCYRQTYEYGISRLCIKTIAYMLRKHHYPVVGTV